MSGDFANYSNAASWDSQTGNVTTVGTNGGASANAASYDSPNVGFCLATSVAVVPEPSTWVMGMAGLA